MEAEKWDEQKWKAEVFDRINTTPAANMTIREQAALTILNSLLSNPAYFKHFIQKGGECEDDPDEVLQYAIYDAETYSRKLFEHLDECQ